MLIRDAEAENLLQDIVTPLLKVAGLQPEAVHLLLLNDESPNAFITERFNLFVHTGLIVKSVNSNQLVGVLAHEIGHVTGGHLSALHEKVSAVRIGSLLTMLAGTAIAVSTQNGNIGTGIAMVGQDVLLRDLYSFSSTQEASADQAAVRLLDLTQQSAKGLVDFFAILGNQELFLSQKRNSYIRTHPLTKERIFLLRHHLETSNYSGAQTNPAIEQRYYRVRAKLLAFSEEPKSIIIATANNHHKESLAVQNENTSYLRYAQALSFYRGANLVQALSSIDGLINEFPRDPYFFEMKGQMLFGSGRLIEATAAYQKAIDLAPDHALLHATFGQILLEREETPLLDDAVKHIIVALDREPGNVFFWRLLSVAYGRKGDQAMAAYAMAEHAVLTNRPEEASYYAQKAIQLLPENTPSSLRSQDIKLHAKCCMRREKREENSQ